MAAEAFPILQDYRWHYRRRDGQDIPECPDSMPWGLIEPHDEQAKKNHGQSLRRLSERGGLAPSEAVAVLENRHYWRMTDFEAINRLNELIRGDS